MATEDDLRSCCPTGDLLRWLHPGYHYDGKLFESQHWSEVPTWLGLDIADLRKELFRTRRKFLSFVAEVDVLLEDAAVGVLKQEYSDSLNLGTKQVVRTARNRDVIELRLPEPFDINGKRYRSRIYYAEPDSMQDLVSLGHLMKDTDAATWREQQNEKIDHCTQRLVSWQQNQNHPGVE